MCLLNIGLWKLFLKPRLSVFKINFWLLETALDMHMF